MSAHGSQVLVRGCSSALLTLIALAVQPQAGGQAAAGSLGGRVTVRDGGTVTPVRRARVWLTSSTGDVQSASTDVDGRYQFDRLVPGRRALEVLKPGFYVSSHGSTSLARAVTTVEIRAGATTRADVAVERGAAVEGRLIDWDGEPAKNAVIRIRSYPDVNASLPAFIQPARSDDRGFFRLHTLPPGDYIVEADVLSRRTSEALRGVTAGTPTYYPGVASIQDATRVHVRPQTTTRGIDFSLAAPQVPSRPSPTAASADTRPPAAATSRIAGRILSTGDSAIGGATVNVMPWDPSSDVERVRVISDEHGRFDVAVVPGTYQIRVMADGFATRAFGWAPEAPKGRPIELAADQTFARADVIMPKHGAVEGRIVDEFGDPAPGVSVELARLDFGAGATRLVPEVRSRPTDDRGIYRIIDVPPDDYYLLAVSGPFVRDSAAGAAGFALTFYPGTRAGPEAKAVRVGAGADTSAVEFAVVPAATSDVRGRVTASGGVPLPGALVGLMPLSNGDVRIMLTRASATTDADGSFVFRDIPEGSYAIHAQRSSFATPAAEGKPTPPVFGYSTVEVGATAPPDVLVEARPPATLAGRVVFEGGSAIPSTGDVQIRTVPVDFVSAPFETLLRNPQWTEGNTFTLAGVVGRQVIRATARPESWVLTRVLHRGVDVTDLPIDFGRGDISDVEVRLNSIGGTISGRVTDENGAVVDDYRVIVFAEDPSRWGWPSRFVVLGQPNQLGEYRIAGLTPGDYRVVALSNVPAGVWRSPDFLKSLVEASVSSRLLPGQDLSVTLKLVR